MLANPDNILYAYFEGPIVFSDTNFTAPLRRNDVEYDALCTKIEMTSKHMHQLLDELFNDRTAEELKNELNDLMNRFHNIVETFDDIPSDYDPYELDDLDVRIYDVCTKISRINPTLFKEIANDYEEIYFLQDDKYNEFDKYYLDDL